MKRTLVLLISLLTIVLSIHADEFPVELTDNGNNKGELHHGNRAPALLPSVTYEDDNVFIYAPYYIESMEVVIYDASGQSIYTYTSVMVSGKNTIILPTAISEEKYAIELTYGDVCLVGYF